MENPDKISSSVLRQFPEFVEFQTPKSGDGDARTTIKSEELPAPRKDFIRKWRLKHRAVTDSLQEAGDRLFTFTRLPSSQWRSVRTRMVKN
jgi:hypothetical protein